MIRNLNQLNFQSYGATMAERESEDAHNSQGSISLSPDSTQVYQTVTETRLNCDSGVLILSVSRDNLRYEDFYLDKAVLLQPGIYVALTAFQHSACVQIGGICPMRLIQTKPAYTGYLVEPKIQIKRLYTFFYQEKEQGFLFPGEAHSMLELTYVDQGSLHSVADGQDLLLSQGDMVLYGPNQWHMQYADIGMAPRYITLSFDAEGIDLSHMVNRKFRSPQKAITLLQQMLREQERQAPDSSDLILCLLTQLLICLGRTGAENDEKLQPVHSINSENEIIRRAQQFISTHVRQKLSVPVVARNVDVSASYLTALFHKHLQISPGEYIRRIKLQQSKQMIREGNMNLSQISTELQYSTIHHFSRQFKEKFGITPSEYAKSVR